MSDGPNDATRSANKVADVEDAAFKLANALRQTEDKMFTPSTRRRLSTPTMSSETTLATS